MFLLVPVFAWLVGVAWRRRGRHYPQHLYFALHVHAAWFAVAALAELLEAFAPSSVAEAFGPIPPVYGFLYAMLAFRRAYGATLSRASGGRLPSCWRTSSSSVSSLSGLRWR
jgi:hypothetical protein